MLARPSKASALTYRSLDQSCHQRRERREPPTTSRGSVAQVCTALWLIPDSYAIILAASTRWAAFLWPESALTPSGDMIGNHVKMGIVGLPNVGKSSTFNLMCGMQVDIMPPWRSCSLVPST